MPINYLSLQPQITQMAVAANTRKTEIESRLEQCRHTLDEYANEIPALQQKVEKAISDEKSLRCAVPVSEALTAHLAAAEINDPYTILAADGSQITPNPHEAVFYGLVNVGVFRMTIGKGETPQTNTWSDLIYEESDPDNREIISEDLISLRRDVFEREILSRLAKQEQAPLLTLTDGPLELYHEPREDKNFRNYFKKYINALNELALLNTITAGYIDRPRAALLVNLLELVAPPGPNGETPDHPFAGVSDLALMAGLLQPEERSAVFALQSRSASQFEDQISLHFFYLNVGTTARPSIARVEVPRWVAYSNHSINLLHAALVSQARQAGAAPYPYALLRAHETAVVKMDEHEYLDALIQTELISQGLPPAFNSDKLIHKLTGKRTRY